MKQQRGPFPRGKMVDMTDWRFGRLRVLAKVANKPRGQPIWLCWCDCGNLHTATSGNLRSGRTLSCGCLYRESRAWVTRTHGLTHTQEYITWRAMIDKCYAPANSQYKKFGGAGIRVCEEWQPPLGVIQFVEDLGPRPEGQVLGRIDMEKDFGPDNCTWVPRYHVARMRLNCRLLTWRGETRTTAEWARHLGIRYKTLAHRLREWDDVDRALSTPVKSWGRGQHGEK